MDMKEGVSDAQMHDRPIRVCMDDREPRERMLAAFASCGSFAVEIQRLPVGDYLIDDALLIERKTLPDLVQSIIQGRLFSQALRLVEARCPAALLLEGTARDLQGSEMRWEAIQGALVTVTLFMGLPILRTLAFAARQRQAVTTDALTRRTRRPKRKAALQSHILQGLPGVGPKRAKQLIDRFGSVEAVCTAAADMLGEVDGLGPDTVRKIRYAVEEPRSEYAAVLCR